MMMGGRWIDDIFFKHSGPAYYTATKTNHTPLRAALLSAVIDFKGIVYLLYVLAL